MMSDYFVKQDLPGVARGRVERFMDTRAGYLVRAGFLEPYDEKRHGQARRQQEREDFERRQAAEELLLLERTNPAEYNARELARRTAAIKAQIETHKAVVKARRIADEKAEQ
jgi:hypothetical protein